MYDKCARNVCTIVNIIRVLSVGKIVWDVSIVNVKRWAGDGGAVKGFVGLSLEIREIAEVRLGGCRQQVRGGAAPLAVRLGETG